MGKLAGATVDNETSTAIDDDEEEDKSPLDPDDADDDDAAAGAGGGAPDASSPTPIKDAAMAALVAQQVEEEIARRDAARAETAATEFVGDAITQARDGMTKQLRERYGAADEDIDELLDAHFGEGIGSAAREVASAKIMGDLAVFAKNLLPDAETRGKFETEMEAAVKANGNKPVGVDVFLKKHLEHMAPFSAVWKAREAEHAQALIDAWNEGQNAPMGTGPGQNGAGNRTAPKAKTFEQLRAGYGAGTLTDAEDAEYLRLKGERGQGS